MKKRTKGKGKRIILYLFLISLLVLSTIIYVLPTVTGALVKTSVVEYGSLQVIDSVTCYFVRDEKVVTADASGSIQYYFEEGDLVRKGTKVLDLVPAGGKYVLSDNYLVSYYIDGHEDFFTPDNLSKISREEVETLDLEVHDTRREKAVSGEPLYKLVDNGVWYAVFWVDQENIVKYTKGSPVKMQFPLGNVEGKTFDIIDDHGLWKVVLRFTKYYEDMAKLRTTNAKVVTSDYEGLMVANENITTKEGKPGVYVKDISGEFIFTPVSVITSDGEYSLVECSFYNEEVSGTVERISTVEAYDEILKHPKGEN